MDEKQKLREEEQSKSTRRRLLYKQRVEVHQEAVVKETSQVPAIQLRRTAKCDICNNDIPYKGLRKHRTACQARSSAERAQWSIQHIQKQQQYLEQSIERYVARRPTLQQQAGRLPDSGSGTGAAAGHPLRQPGIRKTMENLHRHHRIGFPGGRERKRRRTKTRRLTTSTKSCRGGLRQEKKNGHSFEQGTESVGRRKSKRRV